MGKTLPILVVIGAVACGYYILVQDAIFEASGRVELSPSQTVARRAAGAGYVRGAELLYESFTDTSFAGRYADDSFRVNIDVVGTRAVVSSLGLTRTDSGFVDHIVRAEFSRNVDSPGALPGFLKAAIYAGNRISGHQAAIEPSAVTAPCILASVHPKGNLASVNQCSEDVVDRPTLYAPDVRLAPHSHVDGDMVIPSRIGDGASARSPFIWHVAGDLIVNDPVVVHGYVLFLVDGSIRINANIQSDGPSDAPLESSLGLYAGHDVVIADGVTVEAQMFAAGGATVGDETVIVGTIAAANDVTLGRTMIQFRPASRALIPNWVNPAETITMLAYDEQ